MRTLKALLCGSLLAALTAIPPATAQSRTEQLKGDFAFSGGAECIISPATITPTSYTPPAGFDSDFTPIGRNFLLSFSLQGVRTFNGDGTGTITARSVVINHTARPTVNAGDVTGTFTYSVAADGTVTIDQGPEIEAFVAGPRTGQQVRITDIPTFVGRLSSDRNSITSSTFNPGVEVFTRLVPGPELVESLRVCHRARTLIRLNRNPGAGARGED